MKFYGFFSYTCVRICCGRGSSVGIATIYGLDSAGIEYRWGTRFSATVHTGPGAYPTSCTMRTGSFPGVESGRGVTLTTHPLLVPWSRKSRAIPLLPLWAVRPVQNLSACTVELYLYSPYGQYGFYRASVPVQYSYTSTPPLGRTTCTEPQCLYSRAIPLLTLWAVRSLQSLSACTVQLYLYSPYGPYCLYRASVPVQYSYTSTPPMVRTSCTEPQCLYSIAIPLLPYGPYVLYRASVPVQYSYTSIPPMGSTVCTEPQCLYNTAIPLLPLWAVLPLQSLSACTV